jgi:hypothetical protein
MLAPILSLSGFATMKKPSLLLKAAAVVSAVVLVSGFVGYRAGAFGWILGTPHESHMGGSKRKRIFTPDAPEQPTPINIQVDPTLIGIGGSKSISVSPLVPAARPAKPSE